jgi:predicted component of type VI protein secretion system
MRVCPHCGKETRAVDRYCLHCGQRIDPEPRANTPPLFVAAGEGGWALAPVRAGANGAGASKAAPSNPASSPPPSGAASSDPPPSGAEPAATTGQATAKAWLALQPRPGTEERAREFALDGSELAIGRAPNCQIVLADDQLASRRHAVLRFDGEGYTIADQGSSNGTYVNGAEIKGSTPVRLNEGDRITVGEHELLYTMAPAPEGAARPIELTTDGLLVPVPPRWPPSTMAGDTDLQLPAMSAANHAPPALAAETASAPEAAPATPPPLSAGAITAIEQLHTQLVEASAALARRVDAAEEETKRLRSALAALGQRAGDALAALGGEEAGGADLDELIRVASQTAENPRHLDYVTALAERAGDVARALEAERGLARTLEELRDRMAGLAERSDE